MKATVVMVRGLLEKVLKDHVGALQSDIIGLPYLQNKLQQTSTGPQINASLV